MPRADKLYRNPAVTGSNLLSPGSQALVPCGRGEPHKDGREVENEEDSDGNDDDESEEEEENEDWLYDLLVELYETQEREKENGDSQSE
ncbi:hypothetical protein PIB30_049789 [Stylosanthes scabra]|uniref:Uncharacterized protein n=1 Tax=Stylosanthes scabra TaxID=79078 RepID=A0ABU6QH03_9FABA|nr:hypothetical protein [Stylosanthes scabra]